MTKNSRLFLFTAALLATALLPTARARAQSLPAFPPDWDVPSNITPYFIAFLVEAERVPGAAKDAGHAALMKAHLAYIRKQVEAGKFLIVGPLLDGGRIGGLAVVKTDSAAEAKRILDEDPIVVSGDATFEIHPCALPDLSPVRIDYAKKAK